MRYAVLALAVLALLLAATRAASRAPGGTVVPAIDLLSDPAAIERPEAPEPRKKNRKAQQSSGGTGGAAPASAPAPAPAGDDDFDDGDDD